MESDFASLLDFAQQIAREQQASVPAVVKELLHYEILQALMESGTAAHLVFQGGTALRLCHGGLRYSEDLDFAGGLEFDPSAMKPFVERVKESISNRYGVHMEVSERLPNPSDSVPVGRWKAKVRLPQSDRSGKQGYLIHIEVAEIPAYTSQVLQVRTLSDNMPYAYRAILLKSESREEIFADKLIALGARPYIKQRDLWDIHMLAQTGVALNIEWVQWKIRDYSLKQSDFVQTLQSRGSQLRDLASVRAFQQEMLRFLEGPHRAIIEEESVVRQMLSVVSDVAEEAVGHLTPDQSPLPEKLQRRFPR
ncbi:nucleotidyl transferase AbiEii/AbiGii toxin family protein [Ferrimicrobium sp.]|uniref:nucleotidyl transferase AbiEii/AbiGii toxin family protein n=1 Tax=Ferrimicrobium sp. TaxID=2926050 RepID=UPI00262590EA|nr:nucleotidyl transferase AbiEii/AbiGii toxin family protein [Ferrimicrobium sp.]